MRILYLSLSYLPSRRASSVQVMRTCSAYSTRGHQIKLVAKRYDEPAARGNSIHAYYGVEPTFEIQLIARPPVRGGGVVYAAGVAATILRDRRHIDLVYCRDLYGAAIAAELGLPLVMEAHAIVERPWQRAMWRRIMRAPSFVGLVATSNALERELGQLDMLPPHRPTVIARNATEPFAEGDPKPTTSTPPRIGYVGSLYENRGLELIPELARRMPHCRFELVGGTEQDLERWRSMDLPPNAILHGFQPPSELPRFYRAFDVLLMPYPRQGIHGPTGGADSSKYCSPMKMFEYMASGVPMIASDLAVLQEVLQHGRNALIAPAGDASAWQAAIELLLQDAALRVSIASCALRDLREDLTPAARARKVFDGLRLS